MTIERETSKQGQHTKVLADGRTFHDMDLAKSPCQNCGACCHYYRISFYQGELDSQPHGFVPVKFTQKLNDFYACMQGTAAGNGKCAGFVGEIGKGGHCGIYSNRPSPCREFQAILDDGSLNPECVKLKQLFLVKEC